MRWFAVVSLGILSISASALAVFTIPLTKLQRTGAYLEGSPDADRARAALLKHHEPTTVPATNLAYVQYTTSVGIGKPPTYYNLMVDTGSSNTFCGAGIPYVRTSTSIVTGGTVNVTYGSGNFSGVEYLDQVTLGPNFVITNQSIGDALSHAGFSGVDGILGVGPIDLSMRTLSPDSNAIVPTIMNNLASQGLIENQVLGVYLSPSTNYDDTNGALTYGGVDPSLHEGDLMFVPLTETYPASRYWGINITSAAYGSHTIIPSPTAGVVDTGTTLLLLADDFLAVYMDAIPGATLDSHLGLVEIPYKSIPSMQPLSFVIADRAFTLDVAAQLTRPDQSAAWGGGAGKYYSIVTHMGSQSGEGLDFLIGQAFMERYYSVYDTDNKRVGFARTNNTFTTHQG